MDYSNIIIAVCTAIGTIILLMALLNKRFDKIEERLEKLEKSVADNRDDTKRLGERLVRIELHWAERMIFGNGKKGS